MAYNELIDAQFDRAVQMVQSLPKTGPIQTDYEEKLMMYSLFKQATVGNVKGPRPGIWDMLGKAKWDAWAKHKDLDTYEAKQLYVEALLRVLRKYSDKTIARTLVEELVSLGGDATQSTIHRSATRSPSSDTSDSTTSVQPEGSLLRSRPRMPGAEPDDDDEPTSASEDELEDEARDLPPINTTRVPPENRPPSSLSSQRYRTPLAGSLAMSPPLQNSIPAQQPLPGLTTASAFAEVEAVLPLNAPLGSYYHSPHNAISPYPGGPRPALPFSPQQEAVPAQTLERAIERLQIQLAAVTERLETLESRSVLLSRSNLAPPIPHASGSSTWFSGLSPNSLNGAPQWDFDDLGMWSLILNPLSRGILRLRELVAFFARSENRSPSMIIVRRLCLDVSFLLSVVIVIRSLWIRSGVRRREIKAALVILWRAIVGSNTHRSQI